MPAMQLVLVRSCVLILCSAPTLRHPAARQLVMERCGAAPCRALWQGPTLCFVRVCLLLQSTPAGCWTRAQPRHACMHPV